MPELADKGTETRDRLAKSAFSCFTSDRRQVQKEAERIRKEKGIPEGFCIRCCIREIEPERLGHGCPLCSVCAFLPAP